MKNADNISSAAALGGFERLHSTVGPERLELLRVATDIRFYHNELWRPSSIVAWPVVSYGRGHIRVGCHLSARHASRRSHDIRSLRSADHIFGRPSIVYILFG